MGPGFGGPVGGPRGGFIVANAVLFDALVVKLLEYFVVDVYGGEGRGVVDETTDLVLRGLEEAMGCFRRAVVGNRCNTYGFVLLI